MKRIYFICTGNSCRSQMAEGFAKQELGSEWQVKSAGLEAHGVNLLTIQVMQELNIDISNNQSTLIDPTYLKQCNVVVTLCGDARDRCPTTPLTTHKIHWPLPDPANATGTLDERLVVFRTVRDQIKNRVIALAKQLAY